MILTSPLLLNGTPIEKVEIFKYLGLLISSDLSWTSHIDSVCSKAKRILGLLYRRYYNLADDATIKTTVYCTCETSHGICLCCMGSVHTKKVLKPLNRSRHLHVR